MKVIRLEVGQMKANCYLVIDEKHDSLLVIDPGDDAEYITRIISDLSAKPEAILITHGHFDHLLAATDLKLIYNIPIYMDKEDEFLLNNMEKSVKHYLNLDSPPRPQVDHYLENTHLTIGNFNIKIVKTPGHTPGSVSLYIEDAKCIFVGDVIFNNGYVGRYDFKYSNKEKLFESIDTILTLPKETVVYPGHDTSTDIASLKKLFSSSKS
ncbi:MBL fold metallo-hydrolase [Candidatus Woesebacteria bacterium]|nr:MAG: MBL fold metallo-hydrolase [Candidatus Woesebacteria bacterium]